MNITTFEVPIKVQITFIDGQVKLADAKIIGGIIGNRFPIEILCLDKLNATTEIKQESFIFDHKVERVAPGTFKITLKYKVFNKAVGCNLSNFYVEVITKARGPKIALRNMMDSVQECSYSSYRKPEHQCSKCKIIDFDADEAIKSMKVVEEQF